MKRYLCKKIDYVNYENKSQTLKNERTKILNKWDLDEKGTFIIIIGN